MKVAIFAAEIPAPTFIENLIETLAEAGHQIYLFGYERKKKDYPAANIHVYPTPTKLYSVIPFVLKQSLLMLFSNPALWWKTVKLCFRKNEWKLAILKLSLYLPILRHQVDKFHFQWASHPPFYSELMELLTCPIYLSLRGAHINYAPLVREGLAESYQEIFPKMTGFHAVSNAIGKEAEKYGAVPQKIHTIYSAISPGVINTYKAPKEYIGGQLRLTSIGRFHWKKGYNYAIQSLHLLRKSGVDAQYTLVAQGGLPEELRYQIRQLGLENHVKIINGLLHHLVLEKVQESHVLLLPSVEEGVANVVLEAMAVGTIVVSTDCGGMAEVIENGRSGFMVPMRKPQAMADAVINYTKLTQVQRTEMAEAAYQRILKHHTRETMLNGFEALYAE
ncbi:MAG: glycosyltransferase [Flavobacteriaceae bacterium]|nr:glycosyltransferase [Flavobacteriaceae bacterium]